MPWCGENRNDPRWKRGATGMEEWARTRKCTDPYTPPHAQKALSKRVQSCAQATYRFLMLPPCGSFEELQFHG